MITSLLIANRGEIACRIIRTARAMGLRTVAVYSDADAAALHVRMADAAVHIGAAPARDSYLVGERIIAAARDSGAEAIHPGYGFLSENADFAQAVIDAGLVWVGAPPAAIRAMGLKDAAKALMAAAGVPVTPGYMGENQDPAFLAARAGEIGWPVLIKAVAGGGGKGMRRVDRAADFADALAGCQREAAASFGNPHVLIETYIESPRHIEVQVFGDSFGAVVHMFERDCSLQRRHQKVIEEAPAPGMDAATREGLCAAAVQAARAVDYVGAGTIEFIADASAGLRADRIWFMEMNTRLQVEHPVTEAITGLDLVEWQLRVASGEPLPLRQEQIAMHGHAIEARLYAEDPANGFLPSVGRLERLRLPHGGTMRIESGVEEGDVVTPFYDPMIAKLVCHAEDRRAAALGLAHACRDTQVWPIRTNAPLLGSALVHGDFVQGAIDTGFIARHEAYLTAPVDPPRFLLGIAATELAREAGRVAPLGFRLNAPAATTVAMMDRGAIYAGIAGAPVDFDRAQMPLIAREGAGVWATHHGATWRFAAPRTDAQGGGAGSGEIHAPMPGLVTAVAVAEGDSVVKGQTLLTLEAMKMEQALVAPFDGVVAELTVSPGRQVAAEALLVRIEPAE